MPAENGQPGERPHSVSCWNCGQARGDGGHCALCGADLAARVQRPGARARTPPSAEAPPRPTVPTLGGQPIKDLPLWTKGIPPALAAILLAAFLFAVANPTLMKLWGTAGSHEITVHRISPLTSVPFRVLSIEGRPFHHPPGGHHDLVDFDEASNDRMIEQIREELREIHENHDWARKRIGLEYEEEDDGPSRDEFLYGDPDEPGSPLFRAPLRSDGR